VPKPFVVGRALPFGVQVSGVLSLGIAGQVGIADFAGCADIGSAVEPENELILLLTLLCFCLAVF